MLLCHNRCSMFNVLLHKTIMYIIYKFAVENTAISTTVPLNELTIKGRGLTHAFSPNRSNRVSLAPEGDVSGHSERLANKWEWKDSGGEKHFIAK